MSAQATRRRDRPPSAVRHDPTGELGRALRRLLNEGEELLERLGRPVPVAADTARALTEWRIASVLTVQQGFEPEAVAELRHSLGVTGLPAGAQQLRRPLANGLALLRLLESTLHYQARD